MRKESVRRIRKPYRIVSDAITALLVLLLLFAAISGAFVSQTARVRRIADRSLISICVATAYATARYDAEAAVEKLRLDTSGMPVRVVTAMSSLNTLTPREAVNVCLRYRKLIGTLITPESIDAREGTVTPFTGGETVDCTVYTLMPTHAQLMALLTTLSKNMETDGGLFVLARAFYTALMMVAQDSTEVMAINSFENAWKSLSGADEAHIEATATRLLKNNFPITVYARGDRLYAFDANIVFEDTPTRITYASSGELRDERRDGVSLHVEDTDMRITNACGFASGAFSGELTASDGGEPVVIPYGQRRAEGNETGG